MGLIRLRPLFSSDFRINGVPAKQMRHLPSAQEDRDEEKEGGVGGAADVTHQTDVPLYYPASPSPPSAPLLHDYPVSLKLEGGHDDGPIRIINVYGQI